MLIDLRFAFARSSNRGNNNHANEKKKRKARRFEYVHLAISNSVCVGPSDDRKESLFLPHRPARLP